MGIANLNKRIIINDSLNGEILATMDYDDTDDLQCCVIMSIRNAQILDIVLKCLENGHGCYIKDGYKNT